MLEEYEHRMHKLTSTCTQKFNWADAQAHSLREWLHADIWRNFCNEALRDLYEYMDHRIPAAIGSLRLGTDLMQEAQRRLADIYNRAQKDLLSSLTERIEESRSKSRGDGLSASTRLFWLIIGAALGVLGTLIAK